MKNYSLLNNINVIYFYQLQQYIDNTLLKTFIWVDIYTMPRCVEI